MWKKLLFGMRFMPMFEEADKGGGGGADDQNKDDQHKDDDKQGDKNKDKDEKKFSQADLNRIAKQEKDAGMKSILKELGFEDVKTVKDGLLKLKEFQDAQKTDSEKLVDAKNQAEKDKLAADRKTAILEFKLKAVTEGVIPKHLDSFVTLATARMGENLSDEVKYKEIIDQLKEEFPSMFGDSSGDDSSGGQGNHKKQEKKETSGIGKRLGEAAKTTVKDTYFS